MKATMSVWIELPCLKIRDVPATLSCPILGPLLRHHPSFHINLVSEKDKGKSLSSAHQQGRQADSVIRVPGVGLNQEFGLPMFEMLEGLAVIHIKHLHGKIGGAAAGTKTQQSAPR